MSYQKSKIFLWQLNKDDEGIYSEDAMLQFIQILTDVNRQFDERVLPFALETTKLEIINLRNKLT